MNGLSFCHQHFLYLLGVRKIYILFGLRGDLTGHAVLPVQIIAVIEIRDRNYSHR